MTQEQAAKLIVEKGSCLRVKGLSCLDCPFNGKHCGGAKLALEWLQSNGGTMNKNEALKRLDAIEKEQAELRKIIEKGDKIVYDESKIYIATGYGMVLIMAGDNAGKHFRFNSFNSTVQGYSSSRSTGQECLNYHVSEDMDIHVFDDTKEALQFFIDHL